MRQSNWKTRNLVLASNFNMTNVDELFQQLVNIGQHPKQKVDTVTILEKIGHFLDEMMISTTKIKIVLQKKKLLKLLKINWIFKIF